VGGERDKGQGARENAGWKEVGKGLWGGACKYGQDVVVG
jgi:hypothetical protein